MFLFGYMFNFEQVLCFDCTLYDLYSKNYCNFKMDTQKKQVYEKSLDSQRVKN